MTAPDIKSKLESALEELDTLREALDDLRAKIEPEGAPLEFARVHVTFRHALD